MLGQRAEVREQLERYAARNGVTLKEELGYGFDGIVFRTSVSSAVKGFAFDRLYRRERDVYLRLQEHSVARIREFNVPELIRFDDELWVVEMSVVAPPFVLDFAGAYLDEAPDYPEEVMTAWRAEKREQFEERWPEVTRVMAEFRTFGIWLADVKPGNIEFGD